MGKRDYRHRETKKAKKGAKKPSVADVIPTSTIVEVIKKGKKDVTSEEEEEE
ncbi:MAG: hypothetical protein V3S51_06220 [Dehalococcoidia bacterium]